MPKISKADRELFREAVRKLTIPPHTQPSHHAPVESVNLYDKPDETISPMDTLFYSRGGLQHKTLKELRAGKIHPEAEIDLHGMTVNESRENLADFIQNALQHQYRCVRVIHGKGNILKNHVGPWLKQIDQVLAFSSAIAKHGGTGAVYVILKRTRH